MRHMALRTLHAFLGGGLLLALAAVLLAAPARVPGLERMGAQLFAWSLALRPAPPTAAEIGVLRLPTSPAAAQAEQLAAMASLAELLPRLPSRLVWQPNPALEAALAWSETGQRLQAALQHSHARQGELELAVTVSHAGWRGWLLARLAARPPTSAVAEQPPYRLQLARRSGAGIAVPAALTALELPALSWLEHRGLQADSRPLTGPDGRIFLHEPTVAAIELQLAQLATAAAPPVLVIGAADDPAVDATAALLSNLLRGSHSYAPWWDLPLDQLLTLVLLSYYLWLLPRLTFATGFLLTVVIAGGVAMLQLGLQLHQQQWLALEGTLGMLLLGYPLAALMAAVTKDQRRQLEEADQARLALAQRHIQQGELDAARQQLGAAAATSRRLELLYELAIAYERRRQYLQAQEVFRQCLQQNRRFRDVKARLAVLSEVTAAGDARLGPRISSASTLVMPATLEKPMLGRYRLERELGRGAMGVVYLASDPKISRQLAIKTLDLTHLPQAEANEFKNRFFREAEAAGRLSHPAIVTIYDVGEDGELAYIAMDYAPGQPLSRHATADTLLPVETVYALLAEVAEALDYAHGKGIVHRDIKPANLIYDAAAGTVKITDFGIARIGDGSATSTGTILGSPSYMAPEQFAGGKVEGTADLFSLGVTFYQLLTGQLPFSGDNVAQLAYQISQARHADVRRLRPELPASASRIINKALAKKPGERFQSGREMAEALRRGMPRRKTG